MLHVSPEIIWISPIVDLIFFSLVSTVIWLVSRMIPRIPALGAVIFSLSFLAVYDWLTLTGRLYHRACLIFAFGAAVAFDRWLTRHEIQAGRFWRKTAPWATAAVALAFIGVQGEKWWHEHRAVAALPLETDEALRPKATARLIGRPAGLSSREKGCCRSTRCCRRSSSRNSKAYVIRNCSGQKLKDWCQLNLWRPWSRTYVVSGRHLHCPPHAIAHSPMQPGRAFGRVESDNGL